MEKNNLFDDMANTINRIAQGNKSALEAMDYFRNSKGLARQTLLRRTLPALKEKAIYGAFFGALWDASDKDIMIFTKVITLLPTPYCILAGCLSEIDDVLKGILTDLGNKVKEEAIELGIYKKDKSIYNQETYIGKEFLFPNFKMN